jgi:hypothetical protein
MSVCPEPNPTPPELLTWGIDEWTNYFLRDDLCPDRDEGQLMPCYHQQLEARCAAYREAHEIGNRVRKRLSKLQRSPLLVSFLEIPLGNALVGFCQAEYWAREGFPTARIARYRLTATHFDVAAGLLEDHPALGLGDLIPDCHRAAVALRAAVAA